MSKKILLLILLCVVLLPVFTYADLDYSKPGANITSVPTVIDKLVTPIWQVFAALAVIMFLYAGFLFLSAHGDPSKLTTAKQAVLWGVIGVVVMILAFSIMKVVDTALTATTAATGT